MNHPPRASSREGWRQRAACSRPPHTALFLEDLPDLVGLTAARAACGGCPVAVDCAAYAAHTRPTWGILAGREWTERGPR